MQYSEQVTNHGNRLNQALADGDWALANRARNALKRIFLRAVARNQGQAISEILEILSASRANFALENDITPSPDIKNIEAKLSADVETLILGTELRPDAVNMDKISPNAKESIVDTLSKANRPMSNRMLARRLNYADETIARALASLRLEGRVVSIRAGRETLNIVHKSVKSRDIQPTEILRQPKKQRNHSVNPKDSQNVKILWLSRNSEVTHNLDQNENAEYESENKTVTNKLRLLLANPPYAEI